MDMHEMTWKEARRFWALYRRAFVPEERTPPFALRAFRRKKGASLLSLTEAGRFAGLCVLLPHGDLLLLAYLAIEEDMRGLSLGTQVLSALRARYPQSRLLVEIERPLPEEDDAQKQRRKTFYLRNGFAETGIWLRLNGVAMELLHTGAPLAYADYEALYEAYAGAAFTARLLAYEKGPRRARDN